MDKKRLKQLEAERRYREKHPERVKEKSREWQRKKWKERPEEARKYQNEYRKKVRESIVANYGGKCTCCGEVEMKFLALDHINNDGNKQRKEIGTGIQMYIYMKKNMPKDIQVLCHNCNLAKKNYGKCPHKN